MDCPNHAGKHDKHQQYGGKAHKFGQNAEYANHAQEVTPLQAGAPFAAFLTLFAAFEVKNQTGQQHKRLRLKSDLYSLFITHLQNRQNALAEFPRCPLVSCGAYLLLLFREVFLTRNIAAVTFSPKRFYAGLLTFSRAIICCRWRLGRRCRTFGAESARAFSLPVRGLGERRLAVHNQAQGIDFFAVDHDVELNQINGWNSLKW